MRKRGLGGLLAAALLLGIMTPAGAEGFQDVDETAVYAPAAEYLSSIGVMVGDESGNFCPDRSVTRAEMAAIVCRLVGQADSLPSDDCFPDVPIGHWANGYVSQAAELGVVNGYADGNFGPADTVTYEQAVTMVIRAIGLEEEAQTLGGYPDGYLQAAEQNALLDHVTGEIGSMMSRGDIAVLLLNYINTNY